jgi:hypothetical protein
MAVIVELFAQKNSRDNFQVVIRRSKRRGGGVGSHTPEPAFKDWTSEKLALGVLSLLR